ncbi:MAG TPA: methyltransferase [Planktothrix sp. UBA8407]|jgi:2-polyprenyl-3-methyl-5-hydroxy-6-metoxy-1,4-benzoquinol methylase|nr:methyltransferase [Planktothrix sp. UBA8402]HAO13631.1 methyltransferase [Planktothrix sp. UBA8407]HBK23866.1 methyltransferase [Planktothrix sp. UBA10369]
MAKQYIPNALLKVENSQVYGVFSWSHCPPELILAQSWLAVLEIFIYQHDIESAYKTFQKIKSAPSSEKITEAIQNHSSIISNQALVLLREGHLTILEKDFNSFFDETQQFDLSALSQINPQVLVHLFSPFSLKNDLEEINNIEDFTKIVIHLERAGLLSIANKSIDWGDLKRTNPICQAFGFLRGQPIDRYYLDKFIEKIRPEIVGNILEIGAIETAKESYQLTEESSYHVLNMDRWSGVDIVGDAHDINVIQPESFDTIILFNVLEHCYAPWIVIENIHRWLKPGGKCFASVPSALKIHDAPQDYWRPLPDAFAWMLRNFSQQKISTYGNLITVVAAYHGIVTEELTTEELDAYHPDYPVITCISATK